MNTFFIRHRTPIITSLMLVGLWLLFTVYSPQTFTHMRIYTSFMSTIPFTAMLAFCLTLLVIAREIDMSFPSVIALGGYVFAAIFQATQSPLLAFAAAAIVGMLCGVLNGLLVVWFNIPSIIATIGSQFFIGGLTTVIADGLALSLPSARYLVPCNDGRSDHRCDPCSSGMVYCYFSVFVADFIKTCFRR